MALDDSGPSDDGVAKQRQVALHRGLPDQHGGALEGHGAQEGHIALLAGGPKVQFVELGLGPRVHGAALEDHQVQELDLAGDVHAAGHLGAAGHREAAAEDLGAPRGDGHAVPNGQALGQAGVPIDICISCGAEAAGGDGHALHHLKPAAYAAIPRHRCVAGHGQVAAEGHFLATQHQQVKILQCAVRVVAGHDPHGLAPLGVAGGRPQNEAAILPARGHPVLPLGGVGVEVEVAGAQLLGQPQLPVGGQPMGVVRHRGLIGLVGVLGHLGEVGLDGIGHRSKVNGLEAVLRRAKTDLEGQVLVLGYDLVELAAHVLANGEVQDAAVDLHIGELLHAKGPGGPDDLDIDRVEHALAQRQFGLGDPGLELEDLRHGLQGDLLKLDGTGIVLQASTLHDLAPCRPCADKQHHAKSRPRHRRPVVETCNLAHRNPSRRVADR